jgi:hypothetical protein
MPEVASISRRISRSWSGSAAWPISRSLLSAPSRIATVISKTPMAALASKNAAFTVVSGELRKCSIRPTWRALACAFVRQAPDQRKALGQPRQPKGDVRNEHAAVALAPT